MEVEAWLARAARARPEWIALEGPEERCSYTELYAAASAGALELRARGVDCGDRVAIALPPGLAFARALHACLLAGAVAVPVDVRLAPAERAPLCEDVALVVDEPLGEGPAGQTLGEQPTHDLDAVAVVIHTSGTSAVPRPVALTYGNFLWSALGSAVALGRDPGDRWLCALPVSHVGGLSILLRSAIYATTAVLEQHFDADVMLRALRERHITLVSLVATMLGRLLDAGLQRPPQLRCALIGGGPVPAALLERARARQVPVSLTYGLSEACSQVATVPAACAEGAREQDGDRLTARVAEAVRPIKDTSEHAGPPLFCTRVRIADDGEILVAGPTVAPRSPARDGWLHTGDLGWLDDDGRLHVSGRKADTIISGGENIAPAEVEAVLEAHADVLEAAVVGRPDHRWGEAVVAIVVPRAGASVDPATLRAHCAERLAPYKVPKRVELVSGRLPRTLSFKLRRTELV